MYSVSDPQEKAGKMGLFAWILQIAYHRLTFQCFSQSNHITGRYDHRSFVGISRKA